MNTEELISERERIQILPFKVRFVNGEFWNEQEGREAAKDIIFSCLEHAIAESNEFLSDANDAGLDYSADDIEFVEFVNNEEGTVREFSEIQAILGVTSKP